MQLLYKAYNVASGYLEFKIYYEETICGVLDDTFINNVGEHTFGYDNEENLDIAVYPSTFPVTVKDFTGDNYNKFRQLRGAYAKTYPFNHKEVFICEVLLNGVTIFEGLLDELASDKEEWNLELTFVDGVNKYKDISIGNPALLKKFYDLGLIKRGQINTPNSATYGFNAVFGTIDENRNGYVALGIENGDKDTKLQELIERTFKLYNPFFNIEFENEYLFGNDQSDLSDFVDISQLNVRRICSNLLGRYCVLPKNNTNVNPVMVDGVGSSDLPYNKAQHFNLVYEDDDYKTYYHNWDGHYPETVNSLKWEKGLSDRNISTLLKTIAKNLFSYYGFRDPHNVFFRHRRFLTDPVELTEVLSMKKDLAVETVDGVKIDDYYTDNYGSDGANYGVPNSKILNYKIPLNAFRTQNGFEYRLNYYIGNTEKSVTHFYDKQLAMRDIPQEVISAAEWESYREFRDKYKLILRGVNHEFDKTYSVNKFNYQGIFRPLEMARNYLTHKTNMTALQLNNG